MFAQHLKISLLSALAGVSALSALTLIGSAGQVQAQGLQYMSCSQLWYARNAIFAQKGHCFRTARGRASFGRRCYPPYGRLNRWEQRRVSRIKNWEYRKGCR